MELENYFVDDKYRMTKSTNNKPEFLLQKEALERGKDLGHQFFIAKDTKTGGKVCTSFVNVHYFLNYFKKQKEKHYYEKLIGRRVEYYDIDGKIGDHKYWENNTKTIIDDFLFHRKNWVETTDYRNKRLNPEKNIFILESKKLNFKKSYHIIIRNGFIFKNNLEQKKFATEFSNYLKSNHTEDFALDIDLAVYSRNQSFRTIGSTKIGSDRTLIRSGYNKLSQTCDMSLFFASNVEPEIEAVENLSIYDIDKNLFVVPEKEIEDEDPVFVKEDIEISDEKAKQLFDCLTPEKWSDYSTCLSLIFLAKKLGINDTDLHEYCKTADNYDYRWVQNAIDGRGDCNIGLGTLRYHLRDCISEDEIKKIFPKTKTYEEIKKLTKNRRTKEEQLFLEKINKKILTKQIDSLFNYQNSKFITIENVPKEVEYVKDIVFPPNFRCIGLHAGLGRGKTSSLIRKVSEMPIHSKVLILSPRITFSKNICAEYNSKLDKDRQFVCYLDYRKKGVDQKSLNFENKIVMSMEGLHYLESFTPDLLIIDEVNANLISHVSVETNGKNIDTNIYQFERMLKHSKSVVVADAFLGSKVCNFFSDLQIPLYVYKYNRKLEKKKAIFMKPIDREVKKAIKEKYKSRNMIREKTHQLSPSCYKIKQLLKEGKKILAFFSTKSLLEYTERLTSKYKCEFYSGVSQNQIPDDLNESWKDKDLIGTTSTITVGINHSEKGVFHTKVIDFNSSSKNNVSDAIQCHYRVRHIMDDEIWVNVDENHQATNFPVNIKAFEETKKHKVEWYKKINANYSDIGDNLHNLILNNYLENQLSQVAPKAMLERYLTECNYEIVKEDEDYSDLVETDEDEDELEEKDTVHTDLIKEFARDCPNFVRMKFLEEEKLKRKLTSAELREMDKYFFIQMYTGGTVRGHKETSLPTISLAYSLWEAQFRGKKAIKTMRLEKKVLNGEISIEELAKKRLEKTQYADLQHSDLIKIKRMIEICKKLGLQHCNDTTTIIGGNTMDELYEEMGDKYDEIQLDMKTLNRKKMDDPEKHHKNFIGLIKECFTETEHSLCSLKSVNIKRITINGKKIQKNDFRLVPNKYITVNTFIQNKIIDKENEKGGKYEKLNVDNVPNQLYETLELRYCDIDDVLQPTKRLLRQKKEKNVK